MVWSDSSDPANPVSIDLNTYKIVPGDTLTSTQDIDMALEGDNILASFDLDFALASSGDLLDGLTITYDIVDENGVEVVPETAYDTAATQFIVGENDVTADLDSTKDYTVRIKVVFPDTTVNRDYTEVNAILNSAQIHVKQVRNGTVAPVARIGYNLSSAWTHNLAVQSDGTVKGWGSNGASRLALSTNPVVTPTLIPGLSNVKEVYAGGFHSMALLNDGSVLSWGLNSDGQFGLGDTSNRTVPTLTNLSNVKHIVTGFRHTLVLFNNGTVASTGQNIYGQLGTGNTTNQNSFTTIPGLINIEDISASNYSSYAIDATGILKVWGYNSSYNLGTGSTAIESSPVTNGVNDVKEVKCGDSHCFAIQNDNDVYAWGVNSAGQLGVNGTTASSVPILFNSLGPIEIIEPFDSNTYVKTVSGDHYLWGGNYFGELGTGNTTSITTPTITNNIQNGDNYYPVRLGRHSFLQKADGSWQSWGSNTSGQLGLGHTNPVTTPQTMPVNPL